MTEIVDFFKEIVAEETSSTLDEIQIDESFHALGLDSVNAVFVLDKLERKYNISLSPLLFWDFPTIKSFSLHINSQIKNG